MAKLGESGVVTIRDGFTAKLSTYQGGSDLVHAYSLGVNLGVAEGQATVGEPGRLTVVSALNAANADAQALGLDVKSLLECIQLVGGNAPMPTVYEKIQSIRSTFQAQLN